jgi:hypothetical protein
MRWLDPAAALQARAGAARTVLACGSIICSGAFPGAGLLIVRNPGDRRATLFRLSGHGITVLADLSDLPALGDLPRAPVRQAVTDFLDGLAPTSGKPAHRLATARPAARAPAPAPLCHSRHAPPFPRVLNATGWGRAYQPRPLPARPRATPAVVTACERYSKSRIRPGDRERGSRYSHVGRHPDRLTGAEAAIVVTTTPPAVLITLETWPGPRSRGLRAASRGNPAARFASPRSWPSPAPSCHEVAPPPATHPGLRKRHQRKHRRPLKVHTSNYPIVGLHERGAAPRACRPGPRP